MASISPLFFIGIFCFVIPVIMDVFGKHIGGWVRTLGIILICLGLVHTLWRNH